MACQMCQNLNLDPDPELQYLYVSSMVNLSLPCLDPDFAHFGRYKLVLNVVDKKRTKPDSYWARDSLSPSPIV